MTLKPAASVTVWTAREMSHDRVPDPRLGDPRLERRLARVEQALRLRRDRPDRKRPGGVGDEAVQRHADVDGEDVAVLQLHRPRDAVHDHRVRRQARGGRIALVALERRLAAARADVLLGDRVELAGGDPGLDLLLEQRKRLGDDRAGARHRVDLCCRLPDDHAGTTC